MTHRFFCEGPIEADARLTEAEAHHAVHVMRVRLGDVVEVFDGRGTVAKASVSSVSRRSVALQVTARTFSERPSNRLIVAAVPPKGDRLKWMIEKLTELGVDTYIPLQTQRATVDPRPSRLEKLQLTVISAAKQCGRVWLTEISSSMRLEDVVEEYAATTRIWIAHPHENGRNQSSEPDGSSNLLLIGPEGGFTEPEVAWAVAQSATKISWPGTILRTETAAVVFASRLTWRSP